MRSLDFVLSFPNLHALYVPENPQEGSLVESLIAGLASGLQVKVVDRGEWEFQGLLRHKNKVSTHLTKSASSLNC